MEIDEFVPKKEIDELYLNNPYYLVPDGEVGAQAFAVIREAGRCFVQRGFSFADARTLPP
jgi:DNA end-binding protein Ku